LRKQLGAVAFAFTLGGRAAFFFAVTGRAFLRGCVCDVLVVAFVVFGGVVGIWLVVTFTFLLTVDSSHSSSSVRVRCHPFVFVVVRWHSRSFVVLVVRWCHEGGQEGGGGGFSSVMGGKGTGELAGRGLLTGVLPLSRHGLPGVFRVRGAGETGSPVVLGSRFDPLCTPTSLNEGRGRGTRWGELPTWAFAGVVLAVVLVVLVVFAFGCGFRGFRRPFAFTFVSGWRGGCTLLAG